MWSPNYQYQHTYETIKTTRPNAKMSKVILTSYPVERCMSCNVQLRPTIGVFCLTKYENVEAPGKICPVCKSFYEMNGFGLLCELEKTKWPHVEVLTRYIFPDHVDYLMRARQYASADAIFYLKRKQDDDFRVVTIVTDENDANERCGVYHFKNIIARRLLTAVVQNAHRVQFDNGEYEIEDVMGINSRDENKGIHFDVKRIMLEPGGGLMLDEDEVSCEHVIILLYSPITKCLEMVHASYDCAFDEYYIDLRVFRRFVEKYGNPGIPLNILIPQRFKGKSSLREESILKIFGYTVGQTAGLSMKERQSILADVMDFKLAKPHTILSLLDMFINMHTDDKYSVARECWKEDKLFVENYKFDPTKYAVASIGLD